MNTTSRFRCLAFALLLAGGIQSAPGFGLLGPFAPWMAAPLAYRVPNAIGGPMLIGQGYRWNVPVITYGYDPSFLDYFGTNGVAAVESAIQIFNDLPPASRIIITNYPLQTTRLNYTAEAQSLLDLKSTALAMLLEQLGLAQPSTAVFCLRTFSYDPISFFANYTTETRNYDPTTLAPVPYVNVGTFDGPVVRLFADAKSIVYSNGDPDPFFSYGGFGPSTVEVVAGGFLQPPYSGPLSVADCEPGAELLNVSPSDGTYFFQGLTADDVGGLAYQLSTNNVAFENLLPDVQGSGTNAGNFVNGAPRPGVDKITFQRTYPLPDNPRIFPVVTNQYVDSYFTNGALRRQTLERVIARPDILFTAHYIGLDNVSRTGTTNWVNNGGPGNDGPGVIQPPIEINFNRFGPSLDLYSSTYPASGGESILPFWGSYDGTTNPPVVYPVNPPTTNFTEFHFFLENQTVYPAPPASFTWNQYGPPGALFSLQTSTDLVNWISIATITNLGGTFTYEDYPYPTTPQRFFRTQPQ